MVYSFALTCWWALRRAQIQFENRNQKRHRTWSGTYSTAATASRATHEPTHSRLRGGTAAASHPPSPPTAHPTVGQRQTAGTPARLSLRVQLPPTNPNSLHASPVFSIGHHDGSTCLPDSCVHLPGSPHPPQPLLPRSACCCARAIIAQACVGTCRVQLYPDPLVH